MSPTYNARQIDREAGAVTHGSPVCAWNLSSLVPLYVWMQRRIQYNTIFVY